MNDERVDPPVMADGREMLRAWLDLHRSTLAVTCQGLSEEQLRRQSMPPSTLSLLGLVRHLAEVERTWFRRVIAGEARVVEAAAETLDVTGYQPKGTSGSRCAGCSCR